MKERIEIVDFKKETRSRRRKEKLESKLKDAKNWAYNNKELIMVFGPVLIGCVAASIKAVNKHIKLNKEKNLKELYCYDRSLGHYWKLRRELTNSEWVEIDKRKGNGERLADILNDVRVLK